MTPEEQRELAIKCGAKIDALYGFIAHKDALAAYTAAVEAKQDARIAQLEEALRGALDGKMESHDRWVNPANKALSTSSDTWLAEHDKAVEVKVLEELRFYNTATYSELIWEIDGMIEERRMI